MGTWPGGVGVGGRYTRAGRAAPIHGAESLKATPASRQGGALPRHESVVRTRALPLERARRGGRRLEAMRACSHPLRRSHGAAVQTRAAGSPTRTRSGSGPLGGKRSRARCTRGRRRPAVATARDDDLVSQYGRSRLVSATFPRRREDSPRSGACPMALASAIAVGPRVATEQGFSAAAVVPPEHDARSVRAPRCAPRRARR